MVYIREAHACDEWQVWFNSRRDLCYLQPKTLDARAAIARDFLGETGRFIPLLLDGMDDRAMDIYGAWPERLYVLGADGTVSYQGSAGPWRFNPGGIEAWIERNS